MASRGHLRLFLLGALSLAGCFVPRDLGVRPFRLVSRDFPFPSGLRVVFQRDASAPSVVVSTVVDAGSAHDPPGKEGLAHLVEHLWFRSRHDGARVGDRVEGLGGVYNAETSWDETEFFTIAPRDALFPLLKLEVARMEDPLAGVTEEAFAVERAVLASEIANRRETNAGVRVSEELLPMVFPERHPYHRATGGTAESLRALTLEDARAFAAERYTPENVTVVVGGDVDPDQADHLLARVIPRDLAAGPETVGNVIELVAPGRRAVAPASPPAPAVLTPRHIRGPVASTTVVLAWSLPGAYREDQPLMEAAVAALNGAVGSMRCGARFAESASLATCALEVKPGESADDVAASATDRLHQLWDPEELEWQTQLYRYIRAGYVGTMIRESASLWRTVSFARYVHYTGRVDRFPRTLDDLAKIDVRDARDFAYRWLNRKRVVTLVVEPEASADSATGSEIVPTPVDVTPLADDDDAPVPGDPADVARISWAPGLENLRHFRLSNGLDVVLFRQGSAPFLEAGIRLGGGWASEAPLGLSELAPDDSPPEDAAFVAGEWRTRAYPDAGLVAIDGPSGNPAAILALLAERVKNLRVPDDVQLRDNAAALLSREAIADTRAETFVPQAIWARLLPGHALARQRLDADALRAVTPETLAARVDAVRAPANATLFLVGDVDLEHAGDAVARVFGGWRSDRRGEASPPLPPPPATLPSRQIVVADRDTAQSRIMVGCRIAPETPAGGAARDLLHEVLVEDLFSRLREETGTAYSVDAEASVWRGGTAVLFVNADARTDATADAVAVILDRLDALRNRAVPRARLEKARWTLARRTWIRNQGAGDTMLGLVDAVREGTPLGGFSEYGRDLAASSSEDLAELTTPCAGHEVVGIIGPAARLEPALIAHGLKPERLPPPPSGPRIELPARRVATPFTRMRPSNIQLPWHLGPKLD